MSQVDKDKTWEILKETDEERRTRKSREFRKRIHKAIMEQAKAIVWEDEKR